jgi:hypothetical protein
VTDYAVRVLDDLPGHRSVLRPWPSASFVIVWMHFWLGSEGE